MRNKRRNCWKQESSKRISRWIQTLVKNIKAVISKRDELESRDMFILTTWLTTFKLLFPQFWRKTISSYKEAIDPLQVKSYRLTPAWKTEAGRVEENWVQLQKCVRTNSSFWSFWSTWRKKILFHGVFLHK